MPSNSRPSWAPICCLTAVLLTGFWYAPDRGGENDRGTDVALIDMTELFKNYDRFNDARDDLKREIEIEMEGVRALGKKVKEMAKEIKQRGEDADGGWAKLNLDAAKNRYEEAGKALSARFMQREAEIYRELYRDAAAVVGEIAEDRGYRLVIRRAGLPDADAAATADAEDESQKPADIMKGMNRLIIFSDLPDLTDEVTDRLNDR